MGLFDKFKKNEDAIIQTKGQACKQDDTDLVEMSNVMH